MSINAIRRKNQILRASFQAMSDKGFHSVTLQDIADYAGVSKGVTSYYFKNKEEVFISLLKWITERIHKNEYDAVKKEDLAIDKLRAYINAVFVSPQSNRKFYRVYLDFLAEANHNEKFRQTNDEFYENCWSIAREIIHTGQLEGVFSDDNIDMGSYSIRALIDGSLIQWLMRNDDELHSFYRDNCFQTILQYLTNKNKNKNKL